MTPPTVAQSCHEFVAGLADSGVSAAFVSPGSRNTPLTLALAACSAIADVSIRDERSAGFMALGFAKATGRPAVVVCTSGSAAAHYLPAVVEANQAATPMIVLTADRPAGLRGTFAPQTMDQTSLYGTHVKASVDLDMSIADHRTFGSAVVETAVEGIPGAVHINVPLDEPLTPPVLEVGPEIVTTAPAAHDGFTSIDHLIANQRVMIITGGFLGLEFPEQLGVYANALGAPVLADAQSRPEADSTIASADLLAANGELARNQPDVVVRFGGLPTSKPIWQWLATSGVRQILVNRSRLTDPFRQATTPDENLIPEHPMNVVSRLPAVSIDRTYLDEWLTADAIARKAASAALASTGLSEPAIARLVMERAPSGSIVFVGSSMPIRDIDSFALPRRDVTVIGNRGVNGIDGTISTALGCALAGHPTTLLIGDVAALHDVSAMAEIAATGAPLRVVVVNNDGGGIFSFLPQKQSGAVPADLFEKHWGTPHGLCLNRIGETMGLKTTIVAELDELASAVEQPIRPELIEVHTDRDTNVGHHRIIGEAVKVALGSR